MKKRNLSTITRTSIILALICAVGSSILVSCGNSTAKKTTGKTTQSLQIQNNSKTGGVK